MYSKLPTDWEDLCGSPNSVIKDIDDLRETTTVYPPKQDLFTAFHLTPVSSVSVVILGQDPYHGEGQAHGLAFSTKNGIAPPSLKNIFRELYSDVGVSRTNSNLSDWASQGVLLLNATLTVEANIPNSHKNKGWAIFTDRVIQGISKRGNISFILWGRDARNKKSLIESGNTIIESAHPSPMSSYSGFFGSKPFSKVKAKINW